jgi:hypothetical protein
METKVCSKCEEVKNICEYYVNPNNGKFRSLCKICFNVKAKEYRNKNKENVIKYSKNYKKVNSEIIKEKGKIYRETNKETIKIRQKYNSRKHYLKNKELIIQKSKIFRESNPNYFIEYRKKNPNYSGDYQKKRRECDFLFKLTCSLRARIYGFLIKNNITKKNKTFEIVGCSPQFLKEYLDQKFTEGMSWDNYGLYGWHIDHIIPLSSAKTEDDVYKLCHYTNLQPLWAIDNLKKGGKLI